ncbi:MAG: polyphenol oxidase family protein [Deltaproteobacteria bacterium]|nr:polyphenol oxidase family protein [Deltaproteobacteria bacterium]
MAIAAVHAGRIPFAFPNMPRVRCVFTTRHAGNFSLSRLEGEERNAAIAGRKSLFDSLGIEAWTELNQVHGDTFVKDPGPTPPDGTPALDADGHATARKNHALCIKTADCQAIFLAHPAGHVAAIHVGWRGNVIRFIQTAVETFCLDHGLDPADVCAVRGPSLGFAEFVNFNREWPAAYAPWYNPSTRCVDLWSLTRHQLGEAGLQARNIYSVDLCTYSLNSLFFSHRRGDTGRQMGLVWME